MTHEDDHSAVGLGSGDPAHRLTSLTNTLAALERDVVLVLDDYHSVTAPEIHRGLGDLVEQQLPFLHLVLITRVDPPFVRSRWKVNGDMVEVRARDLAFDDDQTAVYLGNRGVVLDPLVLKSLSERVSRWPAALSLVANWVLGHPDPPTAVDELASSDDTIADYLVTEVLAQLPDDLSRFLLRTSICRGSRAACATP